MKSLNSEFQEQPINRDRQKELHEKITFSKSKLFLLLKPENENHTALSKSVVRLFTILDTHLLKNRNTNLRHEYDNANFLNQLDDIVKLGNKVLYEEWEKFNL